MLAIGLALAADPAATPQPAKEQACGSRLINRKERAAHRAKMRAAKAPQASRRPTTP